MASALHITSQDQEKQRVEDREPGERVRHGYVYCRDSNPVTISPLVYIPQRLSSSHNSLMTKYPK